MKDILIQAIPYLMPLLMAGLVFLGKKGIDLINAHVANKELAGILTRADYAVVHAVQFVAQTFMDALKEKAGDSPVDQASLDGAKAKAIEAAKTLLGKNGIAELEDVLGIKDPAELDKWLAVRVESSVKTLKSAPVPK